MQLENVQTLIIACYIMLKHFQFNKKKNVLIHILLPFHIIVIIYN